MCMKYNGGGVYSVGSHLCDRTDFKMRKTDNLDSFVVNWYGHNAGVTPTTIDFIKYSFTSITYNGSNILASETSGVRDTVTLDP